MAHFITIAGPMSAGKTAVMEYLKKRYPSWIFVDEINPRTITKNELIGAAQTSEDLEKKVFSMDIKTLKKIGINKNVFVETGIFHHAYALRFFTKKDQRLFFRRYLEIYNRRPSFVIYIDTKPHVSWKRRKKKYADRIKKMGITDIGKTKAELAKYKKILYEMYSNWTRCYDQVPVPKIVIKNSYKTERQFLKEVDKVIRSLISGKSPRQKNPRRRT
ncbi:MAG: deoxynucleoside kinase [Patescibacteria group bacterium]